MNRAGPCVPSGAAPPSDIPAHAVRAGCCQSDAYRQPLPPSLAGWSAALLSKPRAPATTPHGRRRELLDPPGQGSTAGRGAPTASS
eukprot:2358376-Prymnesium_polylepis.1